jgi:hypothetical protein
MSGRETRQPTTHLKWWSAFFNSSRAGQCYRNQDVASIARRDQAVGQRRETVVGGRYQDLGEAFGQCRRDRTKLNARHFVIQSNAGYAVIVEATGVAHLTTARGLVKLYSEYSISRMQFGRRVVAAHFLGRDDHFQPISNL